MKGKIWIEGSDAFAQQTMAVDFQNENLIAKIGTNVIARLCFCLFFHTQRPFFKKCPRFDCNFGF